MFNIDRSKRNTPVVLSIVAISVFVFLSDMFLYPALNNHFCLLPKFDWSFLYRSISYGFVHGSFIHLLMNMLLLFFIGTTLEQSFGSITFLKFYTAALFVSALVTMLLFILLPHAAAYVIGASGALSALLFLFWKYNTGAKLLLFFVIPVNIKTAVIGLIVFDIVCLVSPLFNTGLSHATHLGGFFFGWLYYNYGSRISEIEDYLRLKFQERKIASAKRKKEERKRLYIEDVDPILKKISDFGIESLSDIEREILKRAGKIKN